MGTRQARAAVAAGAIALVLILAGCSSGGSDDAPSDPQATLQQALRAHAAGDLDRAEDLYRQVLEASPDNKYAHYDLGAIAQSRDDVDEAIAQYEAALQTDPDFGPALFNLAIARTGEGDDHEATQLYKHLLEVHPENAAAHLNLGFLLIDRGREERGQHELDEAVRLDPSLSERIDAHATTSATGATGSTAGEG